MLAILLFASTLLFSTDIKENLIKDNNEYELANNSGPTEVTLNKEDKNGSVMVKIVPDDKRKEDDMNVEAKVEMKVSRGDILDLATRERDNGTHCEACARAFETIAYGKCLTCLAIEFSDEEIRSEEMKFTFRDVEYDLSEFDLNKIDGRNDSYSLLQVVNNTIFCTIAFYELVDNNPIKPGMVGEYGEEGKDKLQMLQTSLLKLIPAYYLFMAILTLVHMWYRNGRRGLRVALKVWPNASVTMLFIGAILALLGYFWGGAYKLVNFGITLLAVVQQFHLWLGNMGFMSPSLDPTMVNMMMIQPQDMITEKLTGKKMSQEALKKIMIPIGFMKQKMKLAFWGGKIITVMCFSAATSLLLDFWHTGLIGMDPFMGHIILIVTFLMWLLIAFVLIVKSIRGEWDHIFTWNSISVTGFMGVMMGMESVTPMAKILFTFGTLVLMGCGALIKMIIKKD